MNSYVGSSASTYTGSLLTSGVHNNYRNVRSSLALERVQPIPGLVDTQHRIGAEVCSNMFSSTTMLIVKSWFCYISVLLLKFIEDFATVTVFGHTSVYADQ